MENSTEEYDRNSLTLELDPAATGSESEVFLTGQSTNSVNSASEPLWNGTLTESENKLGDDSKESNDELLTSRNRLLECYENDCDKEEWNNHMMVP
ncbi:unnamed protein product [Allacma fusca]|uniref:Uncharacterized protein n=1 Tax=Allacma fusca TaxID=39272 RepID=A0A8J2IZL7_9HEXA|nr:unnamed protein product [Allacma fusca]